MFLCGLFGILAVCNLLFESSVVPAQKDPDFVLLDCCQDIVTTREVADVLVLCAWKASRLPPSMDLA